MKKDLIINFEGYNFIATVSNKNNVIVSSKRDIGNINNQDFFHIRDVLNNDIMSGKHNKVIAEAIKNGTDIIRL